MKLRRTLLALLSWCLFLAAPMGAQAPGVSLALAAAGDLRGALDELKARYEAQHPGLSLQLSYGASGSLTAQLLQGAPFDVFLSADLGFPEQLQKAGLVTSEGPIPYATGSLTLWVRRDLGLDPAAGLKTLLDARVKAIATANPQVAPYGRAGEAALRQAGLLEAVKPRLVFADNIAQAAQFLQAGTAEAGLISASQARNPALQQAGLSWTVPSGAYPPLRQAAVILKRTAHPEQARAFLAFLMGPEGQALLARHGFGKP